MKSNGRDKKTACVQRVSCGFFGGGCQGVLVWVGQNMDVFPFCNEHYVFYWGQESYKSENKDTKK